MKYLPKSPPASRFFAALLRATVLVCGALAAAAAPLAAQLTAPQQRGEHAIFLPVAMSGKAATPPPSGAPNGGVFPQRDRRTTSSAMAVDASGGMHIAYVAYASMSEKPPAYYAYCAAPSNCVDPSSWQRVTLGGNVEEVQIALTAAGHPRLLYRSVRENFDARDYVYAACDANCTQPEQWSQTAVAATTYVNAMDWDLPQRSFALDAFGRPRFVYYTGGLGDPRKGAFYAACDSGCTEVSNWSETRIDRYTGNDYEIFQQPVLAITKQGQPRVLAHIIAGENEGIHYLSCDAGCDATHKWERVFLMARGYGPLAAWDLELDATDRPRVAIYQEGGDNDTGDVLIYGWCQSNCLNEAEWRGRSAGLPRNDGETPDLELDAHGKPRIAYHQANGKGLGLAWCDANCETADGVWQSRIIESSGALDATFPLPVPNGCDQAAWSGGLRPSLALDARGDLRIGSDAQRMMRCLYVDPNDPNKPPSSRIETYQHTRYVFMPFMP